MNEQESRGTPIADDAVAEAVVGLTPIDPPMTGLLGVIRPLPRMFLILAFQVASLAAAQPTLPVGPPGVRRIELAGQGAPTVHEVRISPGLPTVFRLHGANIDRERLILEGRERMWVTVADDGIVLVPTEEFEPGDRLRLMVPFKGEALPASVMFTLVVHAALAERQIEVFRKPRSAESLRSEMAEKDMQLQRLRESVERLRLEVIQPGGLSGLLANKLMSASGIMGMNIVERVLHQPRPSLLVETAHSFRASGRVAVDLWLESPTAPWVAESVELLGQGGVELRGLVMWQDPVTAQDKHPHIILEADAEGVEARGPFTLKLWEKDGTRTFTLGNVTFP